MLQNQNFQPVFDQSFSGYSGTFVSDDSGLIHHHVFTIKFMVTQSIFFQNFCNEEEHSKKYSRRSLLPVISSY